MNREHGKQHPNEYEDIRREAWKMASGTDLQAMQAATLAQQNDPEHRRRKASVLLSLILV